MGLFRALFNRSSAQDQLTVEQLKQQLDAGVPIVLLDVREQRERLAASIGGEFIPLSQLPARYRELDPLKEIVVYCHHGSRSRSAAAFLREKGFSNVKNLSGGIDAWSVRIDPAVRRY